MGNLFMVILSAFASEITFVIIFFIIYNFCMLLHFLYIVIKLKKKYGWFLDAIICSTGSIFLACYVSFLITKKFEYSEMTIIVIGCILPIIGEIEYFRFLRNQTKTIFVGRLHQVLKNFIQRGEFAVSYDDVLEEMNYENANLYMTDKQFKDSIANEAYGRTQWFLSCFFLYSIIGYIIGLIIFHFSLF